MKSRESAMYFLGLQEMLVYFDPWIAAVVMPTLISSLMVIPYIDTNPLGAGYYTWKQRKFEIGTFLFGFIVLWISMITIGTFIRGPVGMVWPGKPGITTASSTRLIAIYPTFSASPPTWAKVIFGAVQ